MSFDFTVAIVPNQELKLTRELQYIKSALLYADKIRVISPFAYIFELLTNENNKESEQACLKLVKQIIPLAKFVGDMESYNSIKPVIDEFSKMVNDKKYRQIPFTQRISIKMQLRDCVIQLNDIAVNWIGDSQYLALKSLTRNNQIIIDDIGTFDNVDVYAMNYFKSLNKAIKNSYPLFDEQSNDLLCAAVNSRIINLSEIEKQRIKHAGLADNFLQRLPSFEEATIDEIIDIKEDLSDSVVRFRSKLLSYSEKIQSLTWDDDFAPECSLLFDSEIAPAVLEIREAVEDNSFKKNLGDKFFKDKGVWKTMGGIVVGIAASGVIPSFTQVASTETSAILAGGAVAATKIYQAYDEYKSSRKEIEKKDLFFYYKAGELLSEYQYKV